MNPLQFILLDLLPELRSAVSSGGADRRPVAPSGPGAIYQGEMPPNLWIQRQQQQQQQQQPQRPAGSPSEPGNTAASGASGSQQRQAGTGSRARAEELREQGNDAFKNNDYPRAVALYSESIEHDATNPATFTNRALAHIRLGNFPKAAEDCRSAINLDPTFFKGHLRLGQTLMGMNDFGAALDSLTRATELTQNEAFLREIRVLIAKCESRLARTPAAPPSGDASTDTSDANISFSTYGSGGSPKKQQPAGLFDPTNGKASLPQGSGGPLNPEDAFPAAPCSFHDLGEDLMQGARRRLQTGEWVNGIKVRQALETSRCVEREDRIRSLLQSAKMEEIVAVEEAAEKAQQRVRDCVKCPQGDEFQKAVRSRDEALQKLWDMSAGTAAALDELATLGSEDERTISTILQEAGKLVVTPPELEQERPARKPEESSSETDEKFPDDAAVLQRHAAVSQELFRKLQPRIAATNTAAAALFASLQEERDAFESAQQSIAELSALNARMGKIVRNAAHASDMSNGTTITTRLATIESLRPIVQRILADAETFKRSNSECQQYLEDEARLETERLHAERQRIQLQAEIEWMKVKDESVEKIQQLQSRVSQVRTSIDHISQSQREIQKKILAIVDTHHPELAWKAAAGGSQILRWVKGSGLWVNHSIFDYEIVSTLSSTVNGKVYHARRRGQEVALKEIQMEGEKARRRFRNEINIMVGASNHPNVVKLRGVFFDGPFAYIEMPFCRRGSLKSVMLSMKMPEQAPPDTPMSPAPPLGAGAAAASDDSAAAPAEPKKAIPWWRLQEIFRQIASGLASIHDRGVVHADIKPSNILLSDDGTPMITDFGIAKDVGRFNERADLTQTQTITGVPHPKSPLQGTLNFMAPEMQLEGRQPNTKTDIWSLGVTFYVLAAANAQLESENSLDVPAQPFLDSEASEVAVPIEITGGNERLADMLRWMLRRDGDQRPTAAELLAHPYFAVPIVSDYVLNRSLVASDEKIQAVRAFLHVIRSVNRQPTLISVSRQQIVQSVCTVFDQFREGELLRPLMVVFQGEQGIDEGALLTEMFTVFFMELVTKEKCLVSKGNDDGSESDGAGVAVEYGAEYTVAPDAQSRFSEQQLTAIGKVLLKCIVENRPLPLKLNVSLIKFLVGVEPSMQDLESFDKTMAHNLKRLMMVPPEDLAAMELDFSEFPAPFLAARFAEAPAGAAITPTTTVTPANVKQYVSLKVVYELVGKREQNLAAVKRGFMSAELLEPHLRLLSATEILMLLCGQQHLHPSALVQSLEFQGFPESSRTPRLLEQVILSISQNNLRRFLRLCTGGVSIPHTGLSRKIKILCTHDLSRLPVGHGCVFQLDLPDYNDLDVLREKLAVALAHVNDGFHIA
jgi:serine/threonine protein kinase/tetratricopeptide (TPR) repeat protein